MGIERVKFSRYRGEELYFIIGEKQERKWKFSERDSWDVCWYELQATPELCQKAEEELDKQYEAEARGKGFRVFS